MYEYPEERKEHRRRLMALGRFAKALALGDGDPVAALAVCEGNSRRWQHDTPEVERAIKSAISAMATNDASQSALAAVSVGSILLPLLRDATLVDRLNLVRVPLNTAFPAFTGETSNASQVDENAPKPIGKFSTETMTVSPRKIAASCVITREVLLRANNGASEQFIGAELARAAVEEMDRRFSDPRRTGSISNGATSITSGGTSLSAIDADLKAAMSLFNDAQLATAAWVIGTKLAVHLAMLRGTGGNLAFPNMSVRGGEIAGLPVLVTGAVVGTDSPSESHALLLDQASIAYGDEGAAEVTLARHASVQLDSAPASGAQATTSLWQANLVGLRCERWCGWQRRATGSVVVIDQIQV